MDLGKVFKGVKKVLGVLTDILLIGRGKGWWDKGHTIPVKKEK